LHKRIKIEKPINYPPVDVNKKRKKKKVIKPNEQEQLINYMLEEIPDDILQLIE
jgi:hypothetical protein